MTSPSTALAVCGPPAPGPLSVISVIAGDSIVTALNGPLIDASGCGAVEERRVDADAEAAVDALGRADQLEAEAELAGVLEVVGGEVLDALVGDLGRGCTGVSKASRARIAIFAAASLPVTSSVGSASA